MKMIGVNNKFRIFALVSLLFGRSEVLVDDDEELFLADEPPIYWPTALAAIAEWNFDVICELVQFGEEEASCDPGG